MNNSTLKNSFLNGGAERRSGRINRDSGGREIMAEAGGGPETIQGHADAISF